MPSKLQKPEMYIKDARRFQKYGHFNLAIESLHNAQKEPLSFAQEIEIQKLLCFNYRKLEDYNLALYHINNALHLSSADDLHRDEYAICLMNKGVVYEALKKNHEALECYLLALTIFDELFGLDSSRFGLLINALLSIGFLYYRVGEYSKAQEYLEKSIFYFDDNKENDRRYQAVINLLSKIKED